MDSVMAVILLFIIRLIIPVSIMLGIGSLLQRQKIIQTR